VSVTIKELGRALGLDHSTVAYALSGKGSIKPETRERVRQKAREMGYLPNANARRMRTLRTQTLGFVVPDVVLIYNELVQNLFRVAIGAGFELQIALTEFDAELEERAVRSLLEARVDGLVIKSRYSRLKEVPPDATLRRLGEMNVPTVLYGSSIEGLDLPALLLPTRRGAQLLTAHLCDAGHTRFAWLLPVETLHSPQIERIEGTRSELEARGLSLGDDAIFHFGVHASKFGAGGEYGNYMNQSLPRVAIARGRELMERALHSNPRPTAVVCQNEATAIGAILAVADAGLRVPHDVAISATNTTLAADLSPVSLSTVDVPAEAVAEHLLHLLLCGIETNPPPAPAPLEPVLRLGESSEK